MTAQLVLLTPSCAVLAADSAVTVSGGGSPRVYNGVEKITPLSRTAPIAALVYGAASIGGVPWNTLLHGCCAGLDLSGGSIVEAGVALAAFVQKRLSPHIEERGAALREQRVRAIVGALLQEAHMRLSTADGLSDEKREARVVELVVELIAHEHESWSRQDLIAGLDDESEASTHEAHRAWAEGSAAEIFDGTAVEPAVLASTTELILLMFTRRLPPEAQTSWSGGVVVLGFGSDDFWPAYSEIQFDGVGLDGVRLWPGDSGQVDGPGDVEIRSFAQDAGVKTVMNGLHPDMMSMLGSAMVDKGMPEATVSTVFADVSREWFDKRTSEVLDTLELMPQPALCEIAESLVAITALEHRLTGSLETVGGTISVAVLAHGEPLRWAKRPSLMTS